LTQEAIKLQSLYDNLELSLDREPTDEEWCAAAGKINMEALRQTLEEGLEAKNKLVTSNLRMVQRVVNIYIRNGLSGQYNAGDLMQEGIMVRTVWFLSFASSSEISHPEFWPFLQALIRAAEKFEPHRGFRFSTYAMYWIRSAVKRSQTYQSRVITVPQRLHANHKRVITTERELRQDLGRRPTKQELAEAVQMSVESLERCLRAMDQRCYSLDQTIQNRNKPGSESGREDTLIDILDSKTDDGEYAKLSRVFLRQDLTDSLYRHLDRESAHMVLLRFGLVDPDILPQGYEGPLTIAQVGELVGMKPDKVRRKILKSLKDLRFLIGSEWDDYESFLTS
jgi:RNA polymerase sigma factor (sigma-70 family)